MQQGALWAGIGGGWEVVDPSEYPKHAGDFG